MKIFTRLLAVLAITGWAGAASATLIGDTVTFESWGDPAALIDTASGIAGTDDLTVVGTFGDDFFTPTFSGDIVTIQLNSTFTGVSTYSPSRFLKLSGLDWGGTGFLSGATLLSSDVELLLASNLSFTASTFSLDLNPGRWGTGDAVQIELTAQHSPVPTPATLALLGLGLAGLGYSRRKKA